MPKELLQSQLFQSESTDLNITYLLVEKYLADELKKIVNLNNPSCIKVSVLTKFVRELDEKHLNKTSSRSLTTRQLFLIHQISLTLEQFNEQVLKLNYKEYRLKVLYPNIVYILIRLLPKARKFLQTIIRKVYSEVERKNKGIIQKFTNSFYMDKDVIKTDLLYTFLGNSIKKINPLEIRNIDYFYKQVFRNILFYYFKTEHRFHTDLLTINYDDLLSDTIYIPTGLSLYRDVLYKLQIEKYYDDSPTLCQIRYNYNIFRNVILSNEFQNIYFSNQKDTFIMNNNHYKLLKLYNDDLDDKLDQIKKLPTIYRMLKSVHIMSKNKFYNKTVIKPEVLETAVLEELMFPFRNMFAEETIYEILKNVSNNFTRSLLNGEYINLVTLLPIRINQISFINQVRKFIRICLKV